jgi:hypothetical protein
MTAIKQLQTATKKIENCFLISNALSLTRFRCNSSAIWSHWFVETLAGLKGANPPKSDL